MSKSSADNFNALNSTDFVSTGRQISLHAKKHPDKTVIIYVPGDGSERKISWGEFDGFSNQIAHLLAEHGVDESSRVVVGLPNSPEHILAMIAVWKLGATPVPLRSALPEAERNAILEIADAKVVIAEWENVSYPLLSLRDLEKARLLSDAALPDKISKPATAMASGGSTGRPKLIVNSNPQGQTHASLMGWSMLAGQREGQVQLLAGPLYHGGPFGITYAGLALDHTIIIMGKFDAARAVDLVEQYRVNTIGLVPTTMQRILKLPGVESRDFSSIESILHTGAACPPWVKQGWINLVGAEKVYELYSSSEQIGMTRIRGDEWLTHSGSVGVPIGCELQIRNTEGNILPPGQTGEIYMRKQGAQSQTVGSPGPTSTADGFMSVGDLGWVDEDGFLYFSDRRVDMIVTGGSNVFAAEVEAALGEHPLILDVVVIGLADEEWGKRVHAIIEPRDFQMQPSVEELKALCRQKLAAYKVPKTYEFIAELPRTAAGKIRRTALIEERENSNTLA